MALDLDAVLTRNAAARHEPSPEFWVQLSAWVASAADVPALVAELRAAREALKDSVSSERLRLLADWLDLHDNDREYRGPREVQDDLRRFADALDAYDKVTGEGS